MTSKRGGGWALIKKDSKIPGGTVKSAYCLCVTDLSGNCNHIVAMLLGTEYAVRFKANCCRT